MPLKVAWLSTSDVLVGLSAPRFKSVKRPGFSYGSRNLHSVPLCIRSWTTILGLKRTQAIAQLKSKCLGQGNSQNSAGSCTPSAAVELSSVPSREVHCNHT